MEKIPIIILLAVTVFSFGLAEEATTVTKPVMLDGVDYYHCWEPLFEGARIVLDYRGEDFTPSYVQGISGAAFRIGGICPCAPTCDSAMETADLVRLFGYDCEYVPVRGEGIDSARVFPTVLERIKREIDVGRPVLAWDAFTMLEWDVVAGYDEAKGELIGRGSYTGGKDYARAPEGQAVGEDVQPALGVITVGEKTGAFNTAEAELAALTEAVRHARDATPSDICLGGDRMLLHGLACYNRWVDDFTSPDKKLGWGDRYCLFVYSDTHRAAADFLAEIAPKYPAMQDDLMSAAAHFAAEAQALEDCQQLLFPDWSQSLAMDDAKRVQAHEHLGKARDEYAAGIAEMEKALAKVK
jgi:hypothetical protein